MKPSPSFAGIEYTHDPEEGSETTWEMEGHYMPGSSDRLSGHPDTWEQGDPSEVEIWTLTNVDTKESLSYDEFVERFKISDKEGENMHDLVEEHMQSNDFDDRDYDRDDD